MKVSYYLKYINRIQINFKKWYQDGYKNDKYALKLTYQFQQKFFLRFKDKFEETSWEISENKIGINILRSSLIYLKIKKSLEKKKLGVLLLPIPILFSIISIILIIIYELVKINWRSPEKYDQNLKKIKKVDFLFFASYRNYINPMLPVINKLQKSGYKIALITPKDSTNWGRISEINNNVNQYKIEDILNSHVLRKKINERLSIFFKLFRFGLELRNIQDYLIYSTFFFSAYRLFVNLMSKYANDFNDFSIFLSKASPKITVLSRLNGTIEMTMLKASKESSVKTALLPHSYLSPGTEKFFFAGHLKFDAIFTFDKNYLTGFCENPYVNKECLEFIVGNPELEQIIENRKDEVESLKIKKKLSEDLKIDYLKRWILYTTASYDQLNFEVLKNNIDSLLPSNTLLIVKLHPQAKLIDFGISQSLRDKIIFVPQNLKIDIRNLIQSSYVLLTYRSFTNFEAMCLNTPVLTIKLDNKIPEGRSLINMEDQGFAFAESAEELAVQLNQVLISKTFRDMIVQRQFQFIENIFFSSNKSPSNEIVKKLKALTKIDL